MKTAIAKAYDAGQAARWRHLVADVCPFEEGDERDAWLDGYNADLADKWLQDGAALEQRIDN